MFNVTFHQKSLAQSRPDLTTRAKASTYFAREELVQSKLYIENILFSENLTFYQNNIKTYPT